MLTIAVTSLGGGQGKTTTSILLGRIGARAGHSVLLIDTDPQHNLTMFMGLEINPEEPTVLELLKQDVEAIECVYATTEKNCSAIPADDHLTQAQEYLAGSGAAALILRKRLQPLSSRFDLCVIDSPPQRSQISLTVIGAADLLLIPAEATTKGVESLGRTLELLKSMQDLGVTSARFIGVIPFRDKWVGQYRTKESRESIDKMEEIVGPDYILPHILESERIKQALNQGKTPGDLGYKDLDHPFITVIAKYLHPLGEK